VDADTERKREEEALLEKLLSTDRKTLFSQFPALERLDLFPHLLFLDKTMQLSKPSATLDHIRRSPLCYFGRSLELYVAPRYAYLYQLYHQKSLGVDNATSSATSRSILVEDLQLAVDDDEFERSSPQSNAPLHWHSYATFQKKFCQGGLAAARASDFMMLSLLVKCGYNPRLDFDRSGVSCLHYAASFGSQRGALECARVLIEEGGLLPSMRARDDATPLHWAATGANLDTFKYLVHKWEENICSPNCKSSILLSPTTQKDTCLHWAAGSGANDIITWILGIENEEKLQRSDGGGVESSFLEMKNVFGCTPAHFAASGGRTTTCELLNRAGANMLAQNFHGHDPLTKAVAFKKRDTAFYFLHAVAGASDTLFEARPWDEKMLQLDEIALAVGDNDMAEWILAEKREKKKKQNVII